MQNLPKRLTQNVEGEGKNALEVRKNCLQLKSPLVNMSTLSLGVENRSYGQNTDLPV